MARPERATRQHKPLGAKFKVKDGLHLMSAKVVEGWRKNEKLNNCCRDLDENEVQFFDTGEDDGNGGVTYDGRPDLAIMECNVCGRKHYRVAAGGDKQKPSAVV